MSKLMQSVSALAFAAALAGAPMIATAQQQTTEGTAQTEQTTEGTSQTTEGAAQPTEQTTEGTAQTTEQTTEGTPQTTEQTTEGAAQTTEQTTEGTAPTTEQATEGTAETTEDAAAAEGEDVEVEVVEGEEAPAGDVPGTIVMQDQDSVLASDLIGARIYNMEDESIGDVDDVIVSLDGVVEGVVIGVGGFLGIGEKHVAVEMSQISVETDEMGNTHLVLDTTREALEGAPDFMTAADQRAEEQQMQQPPAGATPPAGGLPPAGTDPTATPPAGGAGTPATE